MNKQELYIDAKNKTVAFLKSKIFDILSAFVIIAVIVLSLGALELRIYEFRDFVNVTLECVPFCIATMILSVNYYTKGVYLGKESDVFKRAVSAYSSIVGNLTGEQITSLSRFCLQYNDSVLKDMKESLLHSVAITWKQYDVKDDKLDLPLKVLSYDKLVELYGKDTAKIIVRCKKLKIKGVCPNTLLGNLNSNDTTNLGLNEQELGRKRANSYVISQLTSIFLISLIGIKSMLEWGWIGIALTLFKVIYIAVSSYYKHFDGYEDVTVHLVDHIYRKTDVMKEFLHWYENSQNCKSKEALPLVTN